jgi:hypothetical protein
MATTTVSIGSNQSISTVTPDTCSGSDPYTVTFTSSPSSNVAVGDIFVMDDPINGEIIFLLTSISGSDYTLDYKTGGLGADSPCNITDEYGDQIDGTFKRAFSTITLFESMIDDVSPSYWGTTDDVVGELHADSTFTDNQVTFDSKQSLSSVTLSVYSDDRHDGTAESGALWKPTANSGHNQGILRINIENMTTEWLDISLDSLDSRNTNKAIVLVGTNDDNIIRNNLIHDKGGNPGSDGPVIIQHIGAGSSGDNIYILNNILYNFVEGSNDSTSGIVFWSYQRTLYIYNNTIYKLTAQGGNKDAIGIRFANQPSSVTYIKNNIVSTLSASDDKRAYFKENGSSTVHASNNLSDTTTETAYNAEDMGGNLNDSTALTGQSLADISFVSTSAGSEDLHLDTDSVCLEAGADLGTTNGVNIDIDGVDRDATGVTWDIGADQASLADAGTSGPAFLMFLDI